MNKIKEGDIFESQLEFSMSGNANIKIDGREIFIHKKKTANALHLDTARVEIFQGQKKLEGKVIETVSRYKTEFVGTAQVTGGQSEGRGFHVRAVVFGHVVFALRTAVALVAVHVLTGPLPAALSALMGMQAVGGHGQRLAVLRLST